MGCEGGLRGLDRCNEGRAETREHEGHDFARLLTSIVNPLVKKRTFVLAAAAAGVAAAACAAIWAAKPYLQPSPPPLEGEILGTAVEISYPAPGKAEEFSVKEGSRIALGETVAVLLVPEAEERLLAEKKAEPVAVNPGEPAGVNGPSGAESLPAEDAGRTKPETDAPAGFVRVELRSPMNGEVMKVFAKAGDAVPSGFPVASIVDTTSLWARFLVPEELAGGIRLGTTVLVRIPAVGGGQHPFRVTRTEPKEASGGGKLLLMDAKPLTTVPGMHPGMTALLSSRR
ncbi:MAG: HlyD family efflux transporter periplasmic adaptor subunit [Sutterellaceae bacterium]|nr:HlyD family efflux transporter periplasmic adaptor subunit [Sutterellaceae bacterium]MDD7442892.1 HlyD family efflux transporter periplasmic adaptor subunit [Sutterellaceae bacterium]MDY2867537.1 HlyD family efflux transporter periplasmic adaptor subunit [Mesosutterella sp.]